MKKLTSLLMLSLTAGALLAGCGKNETAPAAQSAALVHDLALGVQDRDEVGMGKHAAGFLLGLARDLPAADCARLGGLCAAEVISHIGARPEANLKTLAIAELPHLAAALTLDQAPTPTS